MDARSVEHALNRIDAALARIEQATASRATGSGDIEERHERLRAAVAQSLRQLDELLDRPLP